MKIILGIMMLFLVIGGVDRICGNKYGYGKAFEEGFQSMGPLALSVAAIYAASSMIAPLIQKLSNPLYEWISLDPALFPGLVLGADMGGYILSMQVTQTMEIGLFCGLILGSTIGTVWLFTLPMSISIIPPEDRPYLATGLLCGIATAPIGCFIGGVCMSFTTPFQIKVLQLFYTLIPVILFSLVIIALLWFRQDTLIRIFQYAAKLITILITILTMIAVFQQVMGIELPYFGKMLQGEREGLTGLDEGILVCGQVAIVLAGAFPMVLFVERHGSHLLKRIQAWTGSSLLSASGIVASAANPIPMFHKFSGMDNRGKIINSAFAVSGSFILGDLLGFVAGVKPEMLPPFFIAKITGSVLAILLAVILCNKQGITLKENI